MPIVFHVPPTDLTASNTLGLSCKARHVVELTSRDQLARVSQRARESGQTLVLGAGSNVVLPEHLSGLVVRVALRGITLVEARPDAWVIDVAGGENWHDFVRMTVANGWNGLENMALIPGTVGAAPVQNIGAYGIELDTRIESVTAWHIPEGKIVEFNRADCGFHYRDSLFKRAGLGQWIILSVRFNLPRPWQPVLAYPDLLRHPILSAIPVAEVKASQIFDAVCEIRRTKLPDPAVLGNAGSFFKNPVVSTEKFKALKTLFPGLVAYQQPGQTYKLAAGWMIEQAGWKGRRVGRVGVHTHQALVLVNYGQATAGELLGLARSVQQSVLQQFGVTLEIEPVVVAGQGLEAEHCLHIK